MFILHAQLAHHSPSFDWLARWVDWNWNAFSLVGNILLHLYDTHIWIATTNITLCWREYAVACSFTRLEHTAAIKMMLCSFCCPFNLLSGVIYLYIKTFLCLVWEPVTDFGLRLQFWSVSLTHVGVREHWWLSRLSHFPRYACDTRGRKQWETTMRCLVAPFMLLLWVCDGYE